MPNAPAAGQTRHSPPGGRLTVPSRLGLSFSMPPARTAYGRLPEWPKGAVCKTVGSAYVGSNPTPATTWENGPLAAETRPGGPFPSRHVVYQCVSPRVDAWQCARTYGVQRPGKTSGAYNRSLCRSASVLSHYRTADSRAFRPAGSSLSSRARRRAGPVRTRGPGGLAGSGPRHLLETPRRDDRVCVAGHRDERPASRGERRCARTWTPRRAAPVTSLITSQRRPLVASAREMPGRPIRGVP